MSTSAEPFIHGYKISADHRWDQFNAQCLVQSLLGFKPQKWHLEHKRRQTLSYGIWPQEYTWIVIHAKHNGQWQYRHVPKEKAKLLLHLTRQGTQKGCKFSWAPPQHIH